MFERVSGVITAKANGRMRVSIANQAGNTQARVRHVSDNLNLLKPWLLVSKFWGSNMATNTTFHSGSVFVVTKILYGISDELDPRHRRKDGGIQCQDGIFLRRG